MSCPDKGTPDGNPPGGLLYFISRKPMMISTVPVTLEYVPIQTIDLSGLDTGGVLPPILGSPTLRPPHSITAARADLPSASQRIISPPITAGGYEYGTDAQRL